MADSSTTSPSKVMHRPLPATSTDGSSVAEGSNQRATDDSNTPPDETSGTSAPAKRTARRPPPTPAPIDDYYFMRISPGRDPTAVYGFIVDLPCRIRWARYYYKELYEDDLLSSPLEDAAKELRIMERLSRCIIPRMVYHAFPTLPRVQDSLLPIDPEPGKSKMQYVFALRDNSCTWSQTVRLLKSDVLGVRRMLGLSGDQMPKWYEMYRE